jgi:hypothetical protein
MAGMHDLSPRLPPTERRMAIRPRTEPMSLRKRIALILVVAALFVGGRPAFHYWDRHFAACQDYPPPGSGIRSCYGPGGD